MTTTGLEPRINFNSIKVRLKLARKGLFVGYVVHFNSIKVRLKPPRQVGAGLHREFQFHKGTIKTVVEIRVRYIYKNFNSIKVRLKQVE